MTPAGEDRATAPINTPISVAAPAKLNLYLHVTGRRDDGFHLLDSLVCFSAVHDTVIVEPADDLHLTLCGPQSNALTAEPDNLVLRAARLLADRKGSTAGAHITLIKRLPVAAGIGGGSADAAAALHALVDLWQMTLEPEGLAELAGQLGADVPVCLHGQAAYISGIGEVIDPAPALPRAALLLVNPGVPLSTPDVFGARGGPFSPDDRFAEAPADTAALAHQLAKRRNDLTAAAESLQPPVRDCLSAISNRPGVSLARMSGSGATCFGLFADPADCQAAAAHLAAAQPGWWVQATELIADARDLPADLARD